MNIKKVVAGLVLSSFILLTPPGGCSASEIADQNSQHLSTSGAAHLRTRYVSSSRGLTLSREEFLLLAKLIHAEARGESLAGQVAVGAVVLNRLKDPSFPRTVTGVIHEENQFSPVNDGSIHLPPGRQSLLAAELALSGMDPTGGCLYFCNPAKARSRWLSSLPGGLVIGNHVFYKKNSSPSS